MGTGDNEVECGVMLSLYGTRYEVVEFSVLVGIEIG